jgi:murein DD-endopeptidase MepM/ murein hydrolase activator NlpD
MGSLKLKELKKSSIYITPNLPVLEMRRYKFSLFSFLTILAVYSFLVAVGVIVILALTPAKNYIYIFENKDVKIQADKIVELEKRIGFLTREIEVLASSNRRLKYAIMLAGTDTSDSNSAIYDSLRFEEKENAQFEGNIMSVFNKLVDKYFNSEGQDKQTYFFEPVNGLIIKKFIPEKGHFGIDYGVKEGSPVYASAGGIIIFSDYTANDGFTVIIEHENGFISVYKHLSVTAKRQRDYVLQGEMIGLSGNSGLSSKGAHLHFEIWKNGKALDPLEILINNRS